MLAPPVILIWVLSAGNASCLHFGQYNAKILSSYLLLFHRAAYRRRRTNIHYVSISIAFNTNRVFRFGQGRLSASFPRLSAQSRTNQDFPEYGRDYLNPE